MTERFCVGKAINMQYEYESLAEMASTGETQNAKVIAGEDTNDRN